MADNARIWSISRHPTEPFLACTSLQKVLVRSLPSLEEIAMFGDQVHTRSVRCASWKPGKPMTLALASFDATISIFVQENSKFEFIAQLEGHENEVKCVAWSCDGRYLASCSRDKSVWIWEVGDEDSSDLNFECVAVLQEHTQDVKHVVWHPCEELLASASYDNTLRIWRQDSDDWISVADLNGHTSTVWCCDFDPNYEDEACRLVSCSDDLTVRIWERIGKPATASFSPIPSVARWGLSEEWKQTHVLPVIHSMTIYAVKWGKGGCIASVGADGRVVIYDKFGDAWKIRKVIEHAHGVFEINSVDWINENTLMTAGDDGKIRSWSLTGDDALTFNPDTA